MFRKMVFSKRLMGTSSDPIAKLFFDPKVQQTLKILTGMKYDKIFRVSRLGKKLDPPSYTFMTDKELKRAQEEAKAKATQLLQMPPVMSERKDALKVLDKDDGIVGFDSAKYIFTDITFGVHHRDRLIVAREKDGTLREASWEERDRMNQIYFPMEGRKLHVPPLFNADTLNEVCI